MRDLIRDLQRLYYQCGWALVEIADLSGLDKATVWRLIHGRLE